MKNIGKNKLLIALLASTGLAFGLINGNHGPIAHAKTETVAQAKANLNQATATLKADSKHQGLSATYQSSRNQAASKKRHDLNKYYSAEKTYLKLAKLYNARYYYDFDRVGDYVKVAQTVNVYNNKRFTSQHYIGQLKRGTKVKVNRIIHYGKTTRIEFANHHFITGLKTSINKIR